ncbi:phosphate transporter ATP-binding protein [Paenibacillus sp. FSL R5-192]|nr:phosphate transporter ATP-binding protein [Paenibacillus sp. FSL R5-192]
MVEVATSLELFSTFKIEEHVYKLEESYTILIVTHNMQQAAYSSQQTMFFLSGEIVEYSPTQSMFAKPVDMRTQDYISGRFG